MNRHKISFKAQCTLFDSLIKPIILYGAPLWTPLCKFSKSLIRSLTSEPANLDNVLTKLSQNPSEKLHFSFLKWSLGVHRKASNVGVWGETGRYPLLYQSIRLTINYYKRLLQMPRSSIINATLTEQKVLNLSWFRGVESFLKLDNIYHLDNVSANRTIKQININNQNYQNTKNNKLKQDLSDFPKAKPIPCKKFRVNDILHSLTKHFIDCWENDKSNSPKLIFYNSHKQAFGRETYLETSKGLHCRSSTTKLRISAHELEIEKGRYSNISREDRICHWCQISMGSRVVENEHHVLSDCDLYAGLRHKLVTRLNNCPTISTDTSHEAHPHSKLHLTANDSMFSSNLMNLLSPHTSLTINSTHINAYNIHHKSILKYGNPDQNQTKLLDRRNYIVNCIASFIDKVHCKRSKYIESLKKSKVIPNVITIKF